MVRRLGKHKALLPGEWLTTGSPTGAASTDNTAPHADIYIETMESCEPRSIRSLKVATDGMPGVRSVAAAWCGWTGFYPGRNIAPRRQRYKNLQRYLSVPAQSCLLALKDVELRLHFVRTTSEVTGNDTHPRANV